MSPDIFASHDSSWIDSSHDISEVAEFGIQNLEIFGLQSVLFGPMGSPVVCSDNGSEFVVEFSVWNGQAIRSALSARIVTTQIGDIPITDDSDPSSLSTVTRTQVDIVGTRPSDFERKVGSETFLIRCFSI